MSSRAAPLQRRRNSKRDGACAQLAQARKSSEAVEGRAAYGVRRMVLAIVVRYADRGSREAGQGQAFPLVM